MKGRKPTPIELREMMGSADSYSHEHEKIKEAIPKPDAISADTIPSQLQGDEIEVWKVVASELEQLNMLTCVDIKSVIRYCVLWVQWEACKAFIADKGIKYASYDIRKIKRWKKDGTEYIEEKPILKRWIPYPEVKLIETLSSQLLRLEQEFGMTPLARTRLGLRIVRGSTKPVDDPFNYQ